VRHGRLRLRRWAVAALTGVTAVATTTVILGGTATASTTDAIDSATVPTAAVLAPPIFEGGSAQAGGNESFTVTASNFNSSDVVEYFVAPPGSTTVAASTTDLQCSTSPLQTVAFAAVPTVTVTPVVGNVGTADIAPTITAALTHNAAADTATGCSTLTDVVKLTFTNSGNPLAPSTDKYVVTLSGITYNIGAVQQLATSANPYHLGTAIPNALIVVAEGENFSESALTPYTNGTGAFQATGETGFADVSDANVFAKANATATANSPAVLLNASGTGAISPIVVTEGAAGALETPVDYTTLCVVPIGGWTFTAGTPVVTTSPTAGLATAPATVAGSITATIAPSATIATTYTISGVSVAVAPSSPGPAAAQVFVENGGSCAVPGSAEAIISLGTVLFNVQPVTSQVVFGADADGTAATELATAFPYTGGGHGVTDVVLATDSNFPDALAASYLAAQLPAATGLLLTPTNTVSSITFQAICNEGVTTVYVAGGPLAISTSDITELEGTRTCGFGGTVNSANPNLTVVQLFGQTQYDTAQILAEFPGVAKVGTVNISGAYTGKYNDTTGLSTAAPASAALPTAIVVTGTNFQDASSASVMAYNNKFPVILTSPTSLSPEASSALTSLGIRQVILVGGPLAVSDTVEGQIAALGPAVLRIAGTDYTDTSQLLAQFELNLNAAGPPAAFLGLGWSASWGGQVFVARGDFFADALSGASVGVNSAVGGGVHHMPLLEIENPNTVGTYVTSFLNTGGNAAVGGIDGLTLLGSSGAIGTINVLGGPLAVTFPTTLAMQAAVAAG